MKRRYKNEINDERSVFQCCIFCDRKYVCKLVLDFNVNVIKNFLSSSELIMYYDFCNGAGSNEMNMYLSCIDIKMKK